MFALSSSQISPDQQKKIILENISKKLEGIEKFKGIQQKIKILLFQDKVPLTLAQTRKINNILERLVETEALYNILLNSWEDKKRKKFKEFIKWREKEIEKLIIFLEKILEELIKYSLNKQGIN